ncbi:MAG: ABC transporter permease [Lachnospiraceae bacterium]|nr:ABC transporter permease [Lachnospiraceae bacterium]
MKAVFLKELKLNLKNFLIWSLSVGGLGFFCILLYQSMQGEVKQMADAFSNMGAFSDAFGMSTLSIATLTGYFATEVGAVHGLGSGMFAAILAIGILSKEEEGHTGEFLFSLPVSRIKVLTAKALCVAIMLVCFTALCAILYATGFATLGEELHMADFFKYMGMQLLMNFETAGICFLASSLSGKNRMGMGIALALFFYFFDLIGRVVPDLKDALVIGPYSYANASEIFSGVETKPASIVIAAVVLILSTASAFAVYNRRDLAS